MQELKEDIKSIKQSQARVEIDIAMIKVDVGHHIKRTDLADARIVRIENWMLGLAASLLACVAAAVVKLFIG